MTTRQRKHKWKWGNSPKTNVESTVREEKIFRNENSEMVWKIQHPLSLSEVYPAEFKREFVMLKLKEGKRLH